jgi:hypothetical protein
LTPIETTIFQAFTTSLTFEMKMVPSLCCLALAALSIVSSTCAQGIPGTFAPNPNKIGDGSGKSMDSPHFRVYRAGKSANTALRELEGAYTCFVQRLGWRSHGLGKDVQNDSGPHYKLNVYAVENKDNKGGVFKTAYDTS